VGTVNNDDERDFEEEAYNRAEYFENQDEDDENVRILTQQEHDAIRTFALKWGYSHSSAFSDELVGLLETVYSGEREMLLMARGWGISTESREPDNAEILHDMRQLMKIRTQQ
jgi:hypothetical protein